jgi:hypothetical protein
LNGSVMGLRLNLPARLGLAAAVLACWPGLVGLASAAPVPASGVEPSAMAVDGHQVSQAEFRWYMELERGVVFHYFNTQFHLEDGKAFWEHEFGGTTPRAMLRSNTVARIVREKVEQIILQSLGLAPDISYAAFLAQLDKTNQEREHAARQGKAVYGPVRYTPLQFYEHWKATLGIEARAKLGAQRWHPPAEELKQFYEQNRDLFRALPTYSLEVVAIRAAEDPGAGNRASAVQNASSIILSNLLPGRSLPDVLKSQPRNDLLTISGKRLDNLNADRLAELFTGEQNLNAVRNLAPGEATAITDSDAQIRVVRCVGKTGETQRPYEAVQPQVRERWLAQQYQAYLKDRVSQAQVKLNEKVIEALIR